MYKNMLGGFSVFPHITKIECSIEEALVGYQKNQEKSSEFLIYPQLMHNPDLTERTGIAPLRYHLLDFNSDRGLRGTHLVIETKSHLEPNSAYAMELCLTKNFGMSSAEYFITRTPEEIAQAIREIENRLAKEQLIQSSLFTNPKDGLYQYYVLLYKMTVLLKKK